ncbi:sporulation protein, partial [Methylobacterium oryzihabitans]
MTTNASRIPVDYDGFDGDRQSAPARPAPKGDPLAELARIVGQDDPFRALLDVREGRKPAEAPAAGGRIDPVVPTYGSAPTYAPGPAYASQQDHGPAPSYALPGAEAAPQPGTPADAFNQYLAGAIEREHGQQDSAQGDLPDGTGPVSERPRGRRRLALVGGALGLVAVTVGGALAWRSLHAGRSGGPILVMADQAPLKIQPQNAGGVEIPDQNKQIYDRNAKDGQIKIVNREEQPVDVQQAARALVQETAPVAGASAVPTSPAGNALTDSLGEPRRVRTVSVRPEPPPMQQQAQAARPAVSPIPTMTMPTGDTTPAASPAATPRPVRPQAATPTPAPEPAAPPK